MGRNYTGSWTGLFRTCTVLLQTGWNSDLWIRRIYNNASLISTITWAWWGRTWAAWAWTAGRTTAWATGAWTAWAWAAWTSWVWTTGRTIVWVISIRSTTAWVVLLSCFLGSFLCCFFCCLSLSFFFRCFLYSFINLNIEICDLTTLLCDCCIQFRK